MGDIRELTLMLDEKDKQIAVLEAHIVKQAATRVVKLGRYWLFMGLNYYPAGGIGDLISLDHYPAGGIQNLIGSYDNLSDTEINCRVRASSWDWWQIVDTELSMVKTDSEPDWKRLETDQ